MKILCTYLFIAFFGLGFFGCSNDDVTKEPDITKQYPVALKLIADNNEVEPFQRLKVSLDMESDDIRASYDSIVWIANGVAYGFFDNKWRDDDYLKDRSISDYKLGKHKVYVKGYKDGTLLSEDSIEYKVKEPSGDFLSLNFKSRKENDTFSVRTGLTPLGFPVTGGIGGVDIRLKHFVKDKETEYMILDYLPWTSYTSEYPKKYESAEDERDRHKIEIEKTRILYHNLITEMYGESDYIYEGEDVRQTDLWDEYNKRFKKKLGTSGYPVEIWIAPNASICMYSLYTGWYYVVAEPR